MGIILVKVSFEMNLICEGEQDVCFNIVREFLEEGFEGRWHTTFSKMSLILILFS